jgi:hypothetical protein
MNNFYSVVLYDAKKYFASLTKENFIIPTKDFNKAPIFETFEDAENFTKKYKNEIDYVLEIVKYTAEYTKKTSINIE